MADREGLIEFNIKRYPGRVYKSFKLCCVEDGVSIKDALVQAMTDHIKKREKARQKEAANA